MNSGPPRLGEPNRYCLFGVTGSVLPFPDMFDFLSDELSSLRRGGLPFASIFLSAF